MKFSVPVGFHCLVITQIYIVARRFDRALFWVQLLPSWRQQYCSTSEVPVVQYSMHDKVSQNSLRYIQVKFKEVGKAIISNWEWRKAKFVRWEFSNFKEHFKITNENRCWFNYVMWKKPISSESFKKLVFKKKKKISY